MYARIALVCAVLAHAGCDEAAPIIESTTVLDDTTDTNGPYLVETVVIGADGDAVELDYVVDDDVEFIPVAMQLVPGTDLWVGEIPGRQVGSRISYYVEVLRDGERAAVDPKGAGAAPYEFRVQPTE
jgi:hypothetical protein